MNSAVECAPSESVGTTTLLIGYGSDLRGDDAAGRLLAEAFAQRPDGTLKALSVHQLTPELALDIAAAPRVIFADAYPAGAEDQVFLRRIMAAESGSPSPTPHAATPERMLATAATLYGARPEAWLLGIPAHRFDIGTDLTPLTRDALADAMGRIDHLLSREALA